jgi:alpha-mannosidase
MQLLVLLGCALVLVAGELRSPTQTSARDAARAGAREGPPRASAAVGAAPPRRMHYNTTASRKRGALNVHFVPHTHNDVGWLKTVDQYFYGSHQTIARGAVRKILTAIVHELTWNPDRKFTYVESAFFQRWWDEADERTAATVRALVASGQLSFANGGWSMHDEACGSFADMIDNTALGHRFLKSEFNVTPRATWQIDPFGHGIFQGSVLSSPAAGFNSVFFMRADWQEIAMRQKTVTTEMIWAPSPTLGDAGSTFAGILYGGYCTSPGLSMDFWSDDEPVMDDARLEGYNVAEIVNATVTTALEALAQVPQGGAADGTADVLLVLGCV